MFFLSFNFKNIILFCFFIGSETCPISNLFNIFKISFDKDEEFTHPINPLLFDEAATLNFKTASSKLKFLISFFT